MLALRLSMLHHVSPQKPLVEFKAGRMHFDRIDGGRKLRVVADKRRGKIMLVRVSLNTPAVKRQRQMHCYPFSQAGS